MENVKNVYNGTELSLALKEVVITKQPTTIIFHETLFGFTEDEIHINVVYNNGEYVITTHEVLEGETTKPTTRTMHSDWNFKDYCWAICGW